MCICRQLLWTVREFLFPFIYICATLINMTEVLNIFCAFGRWKFKFVPLYREIKMNPGDGNKSVFDVSLICQKQESLKGGICPSRHLAVTHWGELLYLRIFSFLSLASNFCVYCLFPQELISHTLSRGKCTATVIGAVPLLNNSEVQ